MRRAPAPSRPRVPSRARRIIAVPCMRLKTTGESIAATTGGESGSSSVKNETLCAAIMAGRYVYTRAHMAYLLTSRAQRIHTAHFVPRFFSLSSSLHAGEFRAKSRVFFPLSIFSPFRRDGPGPLLSKINRRSPICELSLVYIFLPTFIRNISYHLNTSL